MRRSSLCPTLATNVVDQQQMATNHRRWSLTQGTDAKIRTRFLQDPADVGVQSILKVRRPHDSQHKFDSIDDEDDDDDDDDDDVGDGRGKGAIPTPVKETSVAKLPSKDSSVTPVKLSLADVESVLGVPKNKLFTPQSISSLSSFVNRVSNHITSDFLSKFQNLGGGEAGIADLSSLNIN